MRYVTSLALTCATLAASCGSGGEDAPQAPSGLAFGSGSRPARYAVVMQRRNAANMRLPYLVDVETGDSGSLASDLLFGPSPSVTAPTLSPDGRILGLTLYSGGNPYYALVALSDTETITLPLGDLPQGALTSIQSLQREHQLPASWSHAAERLQRSAESNGEAEEGLGGEGGDGGAGPGRFDFSPDSQRLLLRINNFSGAGLYLMGADGLDSVEIRMRGSVPDDVVWLPNGDSFVMTGPNDTGTTGVVRLMSAETMEFTDFDLVPMLGASIRKTALSKDGTKLAVQLRLTANDLDLTGCLDLQTGAFTQFATDTVRVGSLAISDDGRYVGFVSIDSSTAGDMVHMGRVADGQVSTLSLPPSNASTRLMGLSFEPGGARLAFRGNFEESDLNTLYVGAHGGLATRVSDLFMGYDCEYFVWKPGTGESCIAGRFDGSSISASDEIAVFKVDSPNAVFLATEPLAIAAPRGVQWSADGRWLFVEAATCGGNFLRAYATSDNWTMVRDLGSCAVGTIRISGVTAPGRFDGLGSLAAPDLLAWTRPSGQGSIEVLVTADPAAPTVLREYPVALAAGADGRIQSLIVQSTE